MCVRVCACLHASGPMSVEVVVSFIVSTVLLWNMEHPVSLEMTVCCALSFVLADVRIS